MSFGFPAYSNGSRHFKLDEQTLADAVRWGETLSVDIAHDGTVTARSECAFPIQCIDWGRNGSNVRSFFDQLSRIASARAAAEGQRGVPKL